MNQARRGFEVVASFLQVKDEHGSRHFLRRGDDLPAWVPEDQALNLAQSGAIYEYEVI